MTQPLSTIPTKRTEEWWQLRHQQKVTECKAMNNNVDLLFLGDSITHAWEVEGEKAWQQYYGQRKALNLGFAGDRTEHLLWRVQNGELDQLSPKLVVLLIGTNNAGHRHDPPEDIAAGVKAILDELKIKLPDSKIILMAIFPRSRDTTKRMRKRVDSTNLLIKSFSENDSIDWLDINHHFLDEAGVLDESVMPDLLHPNEAQYWIWAEALKPLIGSFIQDN